MGWIFHLIGQSAPNSESDLESHYRLPRFDPLEPFPTVRLEDEKYIRHQIASVRVDCSLLFEIELSMRKMCYT